MGEFSPENIVAYRFSTGRRKGYDTLQVDGYLQRLADHVGRLEAEVDRLQSSERAALEVLQQAQHVADETVAAARREADTLTQNARDGLENARKDALATVDAARVEADKMLLSARSKAEAVVERSQAQVSEIEAAGEVRANEYGEIVGELRDSAARSATELRSAGQRLVEMAEHFEFEFATNGENIDAADSEPIDLDEERVEAT